ncbi:MAG: hypothetical protein HDQ87_06295 [Clostridia bacterium]|nr:hypothetical protein [Clostridia bacterium]
MDKDNKQTGAAAAAEQEVKTQAGAGVLAGSPDQYKSPTEYNRRVYDAVQKVPDEAIKKIDGGRLRGMSGINGMWRIKKLTELFGPCGIGWIYQITGEERLQVHDEMLLLLTIELKYRLPDGGWSEPITGIGSAKLVAKDRNGLMLDTDAHKKALTDAISVVCKSLGVGASVYFENDPENKYSAPQGSQQGRPPQDSYDPNRMAQAIEMAAAEGNVPMLRIFDRYKVTRLQDLTRQQAEEALQTCRAHAKNVRKAQAN